MRNGIMVALAVIPLLLAGCGDPNFPLVSCRLLESETLHIGDTNAVDLCFVDPEGDAITVTAEAADPIVQVVVQGTQRLEITGVSLGQTTVTVEATAAGETIQEAFAVTVENRPPETLQDQLPEIVLSEAEPTTTLELTEYFTDPDGHELAFAVASDSDDLFTAAVSGSRLTVESQERAGRGVITVTATDPAGASVSLEGSVSIRLSGEIFRDDFSSIRDTWIWSRGAMHAAIVDGRLRMSARGRTTPSMTHALSSPVSDFEITSNLEYQSDDFWAGIGYFTNTPTPYTVRGRRGGDIYAVIVLFGADVLRLFDPRDFDERSNLLIIYAIRTLTGGTAFGSAPRKKHAPQNLPDYKANVPQIRLGAPMDVSIKVASMLTVTVDGEKAHAIPLQFANDFTLPNNIDRVTLFGYWGLNYVPDAEADAGFYDWLAVDGETFDPGGMADPSGMASDEFRTLAQLLGKTPVRVHK